jgi:hypothetical protein
VSVFDKLRGKKPTFGVVGAATTPVSTEPPPRTIKPAEYGLPARAELINKLAEPHPLTVAALAGVERRDTGAIMGAIDAAGNDWERRLSLVSALAGRADDEDSWLQAWLAAEPDNPIARMTYAKTLSTTAFTIRTSSRAEDVGRDQWDAFFRVLRQAPEHCLHAAEVAPEDPTPWAVLQTIAQGLQYDNDDYRKIFDEVVARAPYHVQAHAAALSYWLPRWFGSAELAESFVNQATLGKPAGTLLTHLRLEWFYFERIPKTPEDRTDFYHGPEVQVAIDEALADLRAASSDRPAYPTQRHWLAYFLTQAGRYAEAYDMFRQIGPYYGGWPWALAKDPVSRFTGVRAEAVMGWEDAGRPPLPGPAVGQ